MDLFHPALPADPFPPPRVSPGIIPDLFSPGIPGIPEKSDLVQTGRLPVPATIEFIHQTPCRDLDETRCLAVMKSSIP